jgi:hypothetical protein
MLNKPFSLVGMLLMSGAVFGQGAATPPSVMGWAVDVQGLVTVSDGKSIASVVNGNGLVDGSRVVTSSSGSVTLKTREGCVIKLNPNQSITLQRARSCEALALTIQVLPGETNFTGVALGLLAGALLGGGGSAGGGSSPGEGSTIPDSDVNISVQ